MYEEYNNCVVTEKQMTTPVATIENLHQLQNEYYTSNGGKNVLFKKQQKFDCAQQILQQMQLDQLFHLTFFIIPNTNKVYFDYMKFKMYAAPEIFGILVDRVLDLCTQCSNIYETFEVHININTFTISAAERYKDIILLFCKECMERDTRFSQLLESFNIYNTPSAIDHISTILMPLLPVEVKPKLRLYNKTVSKDIMRERLHIC